MSGLNRHTALEIEGDAHLAQSISVILSTPIGSRVLRRDFGSNLPRLIDAPINGETVVDLYLATAEALEKWEPRFQLTRVQIADARSGHVELVLMGRVEGDVETSLNVTLGGAA